MQKLLDAGYSYEFVRIFQLAIDYNVDFLRFDADGPIVKSLPTFEW